MPISVGQMLKSVPMLIIAFCIRSHNSASITDQSEHLRHISSTQSALTRACGAHVSSDTNEETAAH